MNLSDRNIPLADRVNDFLWHVPGGTRLDIVGLIGDMARALSIITPESPQMKPLLSGPLVLPRVDDPHLQEIQRAMAESVLKQIKITDNHRKLLSKTTQADIDEFIGCAAATLTHNRDETVALLKNAEWRKRKGGGVEIKYKGKWLHLCRTDLLDDIRTWYRAASHGDVNNLSFYFTDSVAYGSRVDDEAFYIVDSLSDG